MKFVAEPLETNAATVRRLNNLVGEIRRPKTTLRAIGAHLVSRVQLTFRDQRTPWGQPWAPLSALTLERRAAPRYSGTIYTKRGKVKKRAARFMAAARILEDTGLLKNSITYQLEETAVVVGTNKIQAGMLQYGTRKRQFKGKAPWGDVPARPFLPSLRPGQLDLPKPWADDLIGLVAKRLMTRVDTDEG